MQSPGVQKASERAVLSLPRAVCSVVALPGTQLLSDDGQMFGMVGQKAAKEGLMEKKVKTKRQEPKVGKVVPYPGSDSPPQVPLHYK